jgi:hypothetical protein
MRTNFLAATRYGKSVEQQYAHDYRLLLLLLDALAISLAI